MEILATSLCLYVCVSVEGMYTLQMEDWEYWILATIRCVYVLLLVRVCTHVRLGILVTILCVYVYVVVESIYTFKTGNFGY